MGGALVGEEGSESDDELTSEPEGCKLVGRALDSGDGCERVIASSRVVGSSRVESGIKTSECGTGTKCDSSFRWLEIRVSSPSTLSLIHI